MNEQLKSEIIKLLGQRKLGNLSNAQPVSGGSINEAYKLETDAGIYFLKSNSSTQFPDMFEAEKRGLELLAKSNFIIPNVIAITVVGGVQLMLMEWVEQGFQRAEFWNDFGRNLAQMHLQTNSDFGLDHDNYIGSLRQKNTERETWTGFYRDERLIPMIKKAERGGRLTGKMQQGFDALFSNLESVFPVEEPSLLHGDLWSGNMMVAEDGSPSIFDPAVYFGHREMDLAMMALFGGFGERWVDA